MEGEFECFKIKDGLYLGNLAATQDYEFLQINKFSYIVNCSAQIPNYFDSHGIKYLKFKLIKERTHKLWDQNIKKLRKLQKFIEEAEELSLCCIIFSAGGNNRSLVMLTAFLMSKYRWTLSKTLQFIRSKKIYIGLSEHYIEQLEMLEQILNSQEGKSQLTNHWRGPYFSQEESLVSKTYLNSQEMPVIEEGGKKEKKEKRVMWQDKIDKEKKRESKMRQTGMENYKKMKSTHKFPEEYENPHNSLSSKTLKNETVESPLKKSQALKKGGKKSQKTAFCAKVERVEEPANQTKEKKDNFQQFEQSETPEGLCKNERKKVESNNYFSEKELLKLINKNLKLKKEVKLKGAVDSTDQQSEFPGEKGIYKLTINNFISPNINILNTVGERSNTEKILKNGSKCKKQDKNGRALSEKDTLNKAVNDSLKGRQQKSLKNKKNTENSPKQRERKLEKAVSLQFKKNV